MHVAPADLGTVSQGGIPIRFAMLGSMAYVLAECPARFGRDVARATLRPRPLGLRHRRRADLHPGRRRQTIPAGRAFHVPAGGPEHRFETAGRLVLAGFQPVDPAIDVSDTRLAAAGFRGRSTPSSRPTSSRRSAARGPGEIESESWRMSAYVMTRVRMGERSGYRRAGATRPTGASSPRCMTIEWEDDVEILAQGDVFHCPAGPPGHRIEAADPATFIDLTPSPRSRPRSPGGLATRDAARTAAEHGIAVTALG